MYLPQGRLEAGLTSWRANSYLLCQRCPPCSQQSLPEHLSCPATPSTLSQHDASGGHHAAISVGMQDEMSLLVLVFLAVNKRNNLIALRSQRSIKGLMLFLPLYLRCHYLDRIFFFSAAVIKAGGGIGIEVRLPARCGKVSAGFSAYNLLIGRRENAPEKKFTLF